MPYRIALVSVALGAVVLAVALAPAGQEGGRPGAAARAEAGRLVRDLGSPNFRTREAAARKLRDLGAAALPALKAGQAAPDLETRRRCRQLIEQIRARAEAREDRAIIARVTARWRGRDVRRFLERLAREPKFATAERLGEAYELGAYAAARASQVSGRRFRPPQLEVAKLPKAWQWDGFFMNKAVLTSGLSQPVNQMRGCLLVSGGRLPKSGLILNSVVFVVGDMGGASITNSVVVCLGNVGRGTSVRNSVVLASGRLAGFTMAQDSFFEVAGLGRCTSSENSVYLNLKGLTATTSDNDSFPAGAGPLQLFLPSDHKPPADTPAAAKE